jgi:uncharacterized membrane protein (UPF0127 family)
MIQLSINDFKFDVELASTPEERERGLSYVGELNIDAGLLFDFEEEQIITMWMRSTYIPLDMIFINEEGEVVYIEEFCEPESEEYISSEVPSRYCLEIHAGMCDAVGIEIGSTVEYCE